MTKTYNDIEAVNRLLEEKERDLELAAKIGQTLLAKNQEITEKNDALEDHLSQVTEKVNQLKHELIMKDGLLQAFTENVDLSPSDESSGSNDGVQSFGTQCLHKKVQSLEAENLKLKLETAQLTAETSDYEEKEQKLVEDCLNQLGSVKQELELYSDELCKKTEECGKQKEEITQLLAQIVDLQKRVKLVTAENMEYQKHLEASRDSQKRLTKEVAELKDKHDELLQLYEEALEEIRELRKKQRPNAVKHNYMSSSLASLPSDSLASELESSLRGELDYPKGYSPAERKVHNWKVFETAKAAKRAGSKANSLAGSRYSLQSANSSMYHLALPSGQNSHNTSGNDSGGESEAVSKRSSMFFSEEDQSIHSESGYSADLDSFYGGSSQMGRPGIPGANDLEVALRKLSLRRANELNEQDFEEEEQGRTRRISQRSDAEDVDTPKSCRTPDSTLSTGSGFSQFSFTGSNNPYYRLPEKLRIVKPLEGSVTLRHWQQLATPNMGGLFDSRPGVQTKGERKLDVEEENYHISDLEEDDDYQECPSKRYDNSQTINTYTNSLVKHPSQCNSDEEDAESISDISQADGSENTTPRMSVVSSTSQGTSTFSMSLGLAAILNERDLTETCTSQKDSKPCVNGNPARVNGNPARVASLISDSHFNLEERKSSVYETAVSNNEVTLATDLKNNQNVIFDKLKNTGANLYNYLGNWGKGNDEASVDRKTHVTASIASPSPSCTTSIMTTSAKGKPRGNSIMKGIIGKTSSRGMLCALRENGLL